MDILCGGCGRTLTVDDTDVVGDLPCPHCGRLIRVSAMDDEVLAEDDRLLAPLQAEDDLADDFLTKARLALKKKLLVVCGSCGERLTVHQRLAGTGARCPSCGKLIQVPSISGDGEPLERRRAPADMGVEPASATAAEPADAAPALLPETAVASAGTGDPRRARRPRLTRRRRGPNMLLIMLLVGLATGVGGVFLGVFLFGDKTDNIPAPGNRPVDMPKDSGRPDPWTLVPGGSKRPRPGSPNGGRKPPTPIGPGDPTRPGLQPTLRVVGARLDVLTETGLIPAPAGKAFLQATVRIRAGSEPVAVDTADGSVTVEMGGVSIPTLGLPAPKGAFAIGGRQTTMSIPPTASRIETLVFVVPAGATGGKVRIAGVGEADLPSLPRPPNPKRNRLPGTYGETSRFLKLAFADPVMEKLRSAGRHQIVVTARKDRLDIALPQASIRGQATRDVDGSYEAVLTGGGKKLTGRLRFLPDGRHLVLYLADGPYHQVVYERQ